MRLCPDCSGDHRRKDCPGLALVREERASELQWRPKKVSRLKKAVALSPRALKRLTVIGYSDESMRFSKSNPGVIVKPPTEKLGQAWREWIESTCSFPTSTDRLRFYWVARGRVGKLGDLRQLIGEWVEA